MKIKSLGIGLGFSALLLVGCVETGSSLMPSSDATPAASSPIYAPQAPLPAIPDVVAPSKPFNYNDPLSSSEQNYLENCKKRGEC